jgi:hypothetical protein
MPTAVSLESGDRFPLATIHFLLSRQGLGPLVSHPLESHGPAFGGRVGLRHLTASTAGVDFSPDGNDGGENQRAASDQVGWHVCVHWSPEPGLARDHCAMTPATTPRDTLAS